jgi:hypothetical protein
MITPSHAMPMATPDTASSQELLLSLDVSHSTRTCPVQAAASTQTVAQTTVVARQVP